MKKLALAMACLFAVGVAQADDKGGFSPGCRAAAAAQTR